MGWAVFSLSFLVALTGAVTPGPLLTYTIAESLRARRRAFLTGARVIAGHALLESLLVAGLLFGFAELLRDPLTLRVVGVVGGLFLVVMGIAILSRVVSRGEEGVELDAGGGRHAGRRPVVGGILVSMSNPYWWVWWATVGFAFMARYGVSFARWPLLLAFFLGHEAGDLAWYLAVSTAVHLGRRRITGRLYGGILAVCGLFVSLFGLYLGISPFIEVG